MELYVVPAYLVGREWGNLEWCLVKLQPYGDGPSNRLAPPPMPPHAGGCLAQSKPRVILHSTATLKVRLLLPVMQFVCGLAYSTAGVVLGGLKALGKQKESVRPT
jgi:hypothetical protein